MESFLDKDFSKSWVEYILEFNLPSVKDKDEEEVKYNIIQMLKPVINTGARSNLKRSDVWLFLWEYDNIWQSFFTYTRKGTYDPDLISLKKSLRAGYALMLYRSVDMGQMRMIFEPKQSVFQRIFSGSDRKLGFFKRRKEPEIQEAYE